VYAFDKLGMGFTDLPKTTAKYSMDRIIRHAYGFMRPSESRGRSLPVTRAALCPPRA